MAFSIQTNVASLIAQENLRVNGDFQGRTIQRLTSGFRINQSGDDAAGLAIANKFRSDISEVSQGIRNANDGVSQLQIIDGGMNNIAKMLDRLKTLATQAASDTFTGDLNNLNTEFQSLLGEIDRQAQVIGLDSGGLFAKSLSVFIGGGRASGTGAVDTDNGSVTVNLTASTTDSKSLGLKGMQAVGTADTDIGTGSLNSVAEIKANASNQVVTSGYTDFFFAGPGFSDGSKVKVTVNLGSVTDVDSLVTAVNAGIEAAGLGSTQAATAFQNANVSASVYTDAAGLKQLAFSSATSAFQVEAGDQMANAFMGNVSTAGLGTAIATTVTGDVVSTAGAFVPTGVTIRITGAGMTSPVDLTFDAASTTAALAITELIANVAASSALQEAGITVAGSAGAALVFTNARGEKFSVMATGDTSDILGLGSFSLGGAGNDAVDYTTITATADYDPAVAYGSTDLEFSFNGAASVGITAIDLDAGNATAAQLTGDAGTSALDLSTLTFTVGTTSAAMTATFASNATTTAIAAQINADAAVNGLVTASVSSGGYLVITSDTLGARALTISGNAAVPLFGALTTVGSSRTLTNLVSALNGEFAANSTLQAAGLKAEASGSAVKISSQNGTYFRLNAGDAAATATIGFGVVGETFSGQTGGVAENNVVDSSGATRKVFSFSPLAYGTDDQAITVSANDSSGASQSLSMTLHNDAAAVRYGRSIDEAVNYINTQLQQSNNATLQKVVAVKGVNSGTGAEEINFLSALNSFTVSVGTSANLLGLNAGVAASEAAAMYGTGGTASIDTKDGAKSAVVALASAIATLGAAQAAVGKGQNQLVYAISLAQSQISNFSAAESRIRDADVAQEAANLTKAMVLQQASIAAMAQANSSPQAVLALLRG